MRSLQISEGPTLNATYIFEGADCMGFSQNVSYIFEGFTSKNVSFILGRGGHQNGRDARSTFHHISKSKRAKHLMLGALLEVVVSKKCTRLWRQNVPKNTTFRALLEVEMLKKCTRLWREAHFQVKSVKNWRVRSTFGRSDVVSRGRRGGLCTLSKLSRRWRFSSISQNDSRRGTFEEDLQRCIFRGRRSTRDMFIRDVRRSGRWFPERGCILEHHIFSFGKMILCDRCSTSYDLASLFRGRRSASETWTGKNRTTHWYEAASSALNFPLLKEVSQNCFVFDAVIFENWRILADLFRFWRCHVQKLRKSRRIASFSMLSSSEVEEVSQNCFVFDVVSLKNWGSLAGELRLQAGR